MSVLCSLVPRPLPGFYFTGVEKNWCETNLDGDKSRRRPGKEAMYNVFLGIIMLVPYKGGLHREVAATRTHYRL